MTKTAKADDNPNFSVNKIVNQALGVFFKDAVRIALDKSIPIGFLFENSSLAEQGSQDEAETGA